MSSGQDRLSSVVVDAVADAKGVRPSELQFRLHEEIDADALDALQAHDGGTWTLEVELDGHRVEIDADGTVRVDGQIYRA